MAKEILLYEDAYSWTSGRAVSELNDARTSPEVVLRFNGDGGEVRYGWAVIGKAKEIKGKKLFKNDGEANSMYAFAFCYNDNNEAYDTSCFNFHRASYGLDYEQGGCCTDSELASLKDKNDKLRAAMESKIDVPVFTRITGLTMAQLFSMEGRAECRLTADEAFQCNLINRVVPITPEYSEQIRVLTAHFSPNKIAAKADPKQNNMAEINSKEALKAAHPELYKQIFALGVKRGTEKEFERVSPMFAYYGTNPVKIKAAFESGKPMDEVTKMECIQKSITAVSVAVIEDENAPEIVVAEQKQAPAATAKTEQDKKAAAAFQKSMDEQFKTMYPNSKKVA